MVLLGGEHLLDDLGRLIQQVLPIGEPIQGHDREDRIAADEGVAVLQILDDRRDQGLDDLDLVEAAEEAEGDAADVLVGVLEVVAEVLADEDHLREDLAAGVGLVDDLEVQEEELLDGVVLAGEDVADDGDEELRDGLAVEEEHDGLLEGVHLERHVVPLQRLLDLVRQRRRPLVEVDQEGARFLHLLLHRRRPRRRDRESVAGIRWRRRLRREI